MGSTICDLGVAARAVSDNKILLVKEARGSYQGKWSLPKGRVDEGEGPEDAVLRELEEETGATGEIIGLAALRSTTTRNMPAVFICYDVQVNSVSEIKDTKEISDCKWFTLDDLKSLSWVSDTMHNLAIDALSGARMSIQSFKPLSKLGKSYYVYSVNKHSGFISQV
ncbi:MAG: NUDIX hydrolase [Candidatus Poseidoniaceae archaeon]|tara:strand:+ start:1359 stop:1859 length:501 start_codon:yes stop_codon:yes gene_type:complete